MNTHPNSKVDPKLTGLIPELEPPKHFTANVMKAIHAQAPAAPAVYRPVIAPWVQWVLAGSVALFILYAMANGISSPNWNINVSFLEPITKPAMQLVSSSLWAFGSAAVFILLAAEWYISRMRLFTKVN